jgi:hypothetical protein
MFPAGGRFFKKYNKNNRLVYYPGGGAEPGIKRTS